MDFKEKIKLKALFLYGIHCRKEIWKDIEGALRDEMIDYVEYPHEIIRSAHCVENITKYVYQTYQDQEYDYLVGHSMGGIVAL